MSARPGQEGRDTVPRLVDMKIQLQADTAGILEKQLDDSSLGYFPALVSRAQLLQMRFSALEVAAGKCDMVQVRTACRSRFVVAQRD